MTSTGSQTPLWIEPRHHRRGANTRALGTTLRAMRDAGQLETVDEAVIVAARSAAGLYDAGLADPDEGRFVVDRLGKGYRDALLLLMSRAPAGTDAIDILLRELSAPVRDDP